MASFSCCSIGEVLSRRGNSRDALDPELKFLPLDGIGVRYATDLVSTVKNLSCNKSSKK